MKSAEVTLRKWVYYFSVSKNSQISFKVWVTFQLFLPIQKSITLTIRLPNDNKITELFNNYHLELIICGQFNLSVRLFIANHFLLHFISNLYKGIFELEVIVWCCLNWRPFLASHKQNKCILKTQAVIYVY